MTVRTSQFSQFSFPCFKKFFFGDDLKASVTKIQKKIAVVLNRFSENMESISALQGGLLAGVYFFNHLKGSQNSFQALISSLMVFKTLDYATLWMGSGPSILSGKGVKEISFHLPYVDNDKKKGIDWAKLSYLLGGFFSFGAFLKTCEIFDFRFLGHLASRIGSVPVFSRTGSVYLLENIPLMGWILYQPYTFCFFVGSLIQFKSSLQALFAFKQKTSSAPIERQQSKVDLGLDILANASKVTEIALSPDSRKSSPFVSLNVLGKQAKLIKTIRTKNKKQAEEEKISPGFSFSQLLLKVSNFLYRTRKNPDAFQSFCLVNLSLLRLSHWKWGTPSFPKLDQHLDASQLLDIYEIFSLPEYIRCQSFKKEGWWKRISDASLFVGRALMIPFFMEEWGAFKFAPLAKKWGSFRLGSYRFTPSLDNYIKTAFSVGYLFNMVQSCVDLKNAMKENNKPAMIKSSGQILLSTALSLFNFSILCRTSEKVTNTAMLVGYGLKLIVH